MPQCYITGTYPKISIKVNNSDGEGGKAGNERVVTPKTATNEEGKLMLVAGVGANWVKDN